MMAYSVNEPAIAVAPRPSLTDRYAQAVCITLLGYACLGKGFAYVGVPPLFVGEVMLGLGLLVVVYAGGSFAALATLPSVLLALLMSWVLVNALPFVGTYGVDALRDTVIVVYGLFAFVVIVLLIEKPERLRQVVAAYSGFAWFYGLAGAALANIEKSLGTMLPVWPQVGVSLVYLRLGEVAVHLCGITVFVLLGLRRVSALWVLVLLASIAAIVPSRGAMLACVVPIIAAALISGQWQRFATVLLVASGLFIAGYLAGIEIPISGGRSVGPEQIIENVQSLLGTSDAENLDGTKTWRLRWWQTIQDYTFHGPYFWTGKGFGMSLAEEDGFVVGLELGGPVVRSPHNANLTILARCGVPGLVLWGLTMASWLTLLLSSMLTARRRGDAWFANVFLWIACYGLSMLIDASFDVALEGPMVGIWFWCLFGLGIGAAMIYRAAIHTRPGARPIGTA